MAIPRTLWNRYPELDHFFVVIENEAVLEDNAV